MGARDPGALVVSPEELRQRWALMMSLALASGMSVDMALDLPGLALLGVAEAILRVRRLS